jgi:hypothetical protein
LVIHCLNSESIISSSAERALPDSSDTWITLEDYRSGKLIIARFFSVRVPEHFDPTKT